jgi:hypothetical protein
MENILGTSPLEFQDDYFASNISSDDNNPDNESINTTTEYQQKLRKTPSVISLSQPNNNDGDKKNINTGILFNKLRTFPTNSINLENARQNHFTTQLNSNEDNNDTVSIYPGNDTISTLLSPMLEPINEMNNDDVISENIIEEDNNELNKFPYIFDDGNNFEKSDENNDFNLFFNRRQHFFILSSAGKPIYSMHGSYELFVVYSGIIQTIVSFFRYSNIDEESVKIIESNDDKTNNPIKFVFLDKSPIILMTVIKNDQSTQIELEQQLDFIYSFIISALSKPYIDKIFNKYANFDLRNLLGKTDIQTLDSICEDLSNNLNISQVLSGLQCLRMHSSIRSRLNNKLISLKKQDFLYGLVIGPNEKLITIIRPKKHTLHTSDLMILFEMIYNTNTFKMKNEVDNKILNFITNEIFWVPICLPKFNSNGHLYSIIQFHQLKDERFFKLHDIEFDKKIDDDLTKIGIILLSPYKDSFNELRKISNLISKEILFDKKIYKDIWNSLVGNGRIIVDRIIGDSDINFIQNNQQSDYGNDINDLTERRLTITSIMNKLSINSFSTTPNTYYMTEDILHFTVKNKRLVQCIFPESSKFNIYDITIKKNLLQIYKYLRRRLQIVTSDFIFQDNQINLTEDNHELNNNFKNNIVFEILDNIKTNERIVGFACKIGNYEIFIIGKGDMINENKLIEYSLRILRWCKRQERRVFIY